MTKATPNTVPAALSGTGQEVLDGIFKTERLSHDQKWKDLAATDPAFASAALVRVHEIRLSQTPPSPEDAYLRGVADRHAAESRQQLLANAGRIVSEAFGNI